MECQDRYVLDKLVAEAFQMPTKTKKKLYPAWKKDSWSTPGVQNDTTISVNLSTTKKPATLKRTTCYTLLKKLNFTISKSDLSVGSDLANIVSYHHKKMHFYWLSLRLGKMILEGLLKNVSFTTASSLLAWRYWIQLVLQVLLSFLFQLLLWLTLLFPLTKNIMDFRDLVGGGEGSLIVEVSMASWWRKFQKKKIVAKKKFACRMCAGRPFNAMPEPFLCCFLLFQGADETCFDVMTLLADVELSWLWWFIFCLWQNKLCL